MNPTWPFPKITLAIRTGRGTWEMLRLTSLVCDHHEFAYLEDASVQMPSFEDIQCLVCAVFLQNPRRFAWNIGIISAGYCDIAGETIPHPRYQQS